MRIVHLSTAENWRGGEQQILYLHQQLLKTGFDSLIVCKRSSGVAQVCECEQLPCHEINIRSAYDLLAAWQLSKIVRSFEADLIHLHTSDGHMLTILASWLGLSIPMVVTRRVDFPMKSGWLSRYKYNFSRIGKILCVSEAVLQMVSTTVDRRRLSMVHDGIDLNRFTGIEDQYLRRKYQLKKSDFIVGNISALADHKDYFTFIDTAEICGSKSNDFVFFVVGNGPLEAELKDYVSRKGLDHKIHFVGFVADVRPYIKSLDLLLFTSKTEGLGSTVLDAMAAGVPVVATRAGGLPEIIEDHTTGLLAPVQDAGALANHVLKLYSDRKLASQLSQAAHQSIADFSIEKMATKTIACYREVVSAG